MTSDEQRAPRPQYGDTAVVRRRVGALHEAADDVRVGADQLVARTDALAWRGRAADAMRMRVADRAGRLREAAAGFDTAAESLDRHATEAEATTDAIADRERRGRALVDAAHERVARLLPGVEPDPDDAVLVGLDAPSGSPDLPPPGHRAWLTLELPGLRAQDA